MPFLQINGVTIPVKADSLEEEEIVIGDVFARGISGGMFGTQAGTKRRWTFEMLPMDRDTAEKMRQWMEGRIQVWNFEGTAAADGLLSGGGVSLGGLPTFSSSGGRIGGDITVPSGGLASVDMVDKLYRPKGWDPNDGWTLGCWRNSTAAEGFPSSAWFDLVMTGNVPVTRGVSAAPANTAQYRNGVAISSSMGRYVNVDTVAGQWCGVAGYLATNVAAAVDYDGLWFAPFQVPTSWIADIYAFRSAFAFGDAPKVAATGDWFVETKPIDVICRVKNTQQLNATLKGIAGHSAANRIFSVVMEEV